MSTESSKKFTILLSALAVLFLLYPLLVELDRVKFFRLGIVAVLSAAMYAVRGNRRHLIVVAVLGAPAIFGQVLSMFLTDRKILLATGVLAIGFLAFVAGVILVEVVSVGRVTSDKLAGAACFYLLAGLCFSVVYSVLSMVRPESFFIPPEMLAAEFGDGGEHIFIYFSFVTLSTLGYGDITPLTPPAQTLAWIEAIFGQLVMAVLIARLVGLQIAHSRE